MPGRLLLVHAHPDDETINSGATMAMYAAQGVHVTLVTCTLGDEGEILVPEVEHLAANRDDALGPYRHRELLGAMAELGIGDVRILGGVDEHGHGTWRDSGMAGTASHDKPRAFVHADHTAVDQLTDTILDVRPHVVVTYDSHGGYGHPDHIQAHRITHAAVTLSAQQGWRVAKVYACARIREVEQSDRRQFLELDQSSRFAVGTDDMSWAVPRDRVTTEIDARAFTDAKRRALTAHATQISVDGDWYALSDGIAAALRGVEWFTCEVGIPEVDGNGSSIAEMESDIFAGVDTVN